MVSSAAHLLVSIVAAARRAGRTLGRGLSWIYLLAGTAGRLLAARLRGARKPHSPREAGEPPLRVMRRPRVLVVVPYPIVPPDHGGAVRVVNLIQQLSRDCDLYLLVFIQSDDDPEHRAVLEPWIAKLFFHNWQPFRDSHTGRLPGALEPPSVRLFSDERVALQIRDIVERHHIDVVQLEYTELARYREAVGDTPVILVEHDVSFRSFQRRRRLGLPQRFPASKVFGATFRDWMSLLRFEVSACRDVEQIHVMSAADAAYLARFLPDSTSRVRIVPNGVDCAWYRPPEPAPVRRGVLLSGNFHTLPNLDAFDYFMREIWPAVRRLRPDAQLSVIGAAMPPRLHEWHGRDGITVVGGVPDMRGAYHGHKVLAVPLRAGSGTRLKLLEAFGAGLAAVSTTIGAEGIECVAGEHLLIADDAEGMARAVERLLVDDELAATLASNALRLVEGRYDWAASARSHLAGVHQLISTAPPRSVEATALGDPSPRVFGRSITGEIEVSVVIPCFRGGVMLERCLTELARQECTRPFEVVCLDSGSSPDELAIMVASGARVHVIENRSFNHGLTRDLGAELAVGEILVFLNQDALPADERWLENLTAPLFADDPPAAVQGAMVDFPPDQSPVGVFYWNTCGPRFYFTREMRRWVTRYPGPSFSTVNAALRRDAWRQIPFGWAPFMEDKKWQRSALEAGLRIVAAPDARVFHSHDYSLRSLLLRCQNEGYGWRLLGERYTLSDVLRDLWAPSVWRDLAGGLRRRRFGMKPAELVYPWLRPVAVWYGNRHLSGVRS